MRRLLLVIAGLAVLSTAPALATRPSDIVGGSAAPDGAYPAQAYLEGTVCGLVCGVGDSTYSCGATLIAKRWLITAGHCLEDANSITVRLGSNSSDSGGHVYEVAAFSAMPGFDADTLNNDAALLELAEDAPDTPLPLAGPTADAAAAQPGQTGRVIGWGTTSEGAATTPTELRQVDVPIVSDATCDDNYGSRLIKPVMFCAGFPQGGKDSCQGDSGGPFMVRSSGAYQLLGLVSWGDGCAQAGGKYGIYTELFNSDIRAWVLSKVGTPPAVTITPATGTTGVQQTLHAAVTATAPHTVDAITWDLDGDGVFDDATGADASFTPASSGTTPVRVRATDDTGLVTVVQRDVTVTDPGTPAPTTTTTDTAPVTTTPAPATTSATTATEPPAAPPQPVTPRATRGVPLIKVSARTGGHRLRVTGTVLGDGCGGGDLRLMIKRGGRLLDRFTSALGDDCTFARTYEVRGRLKIYVAFLGTDALEPYKLVKERRVQ